MKKVKYIFVCLLIVILFTVGCGEAPQKGQTSSGIKNYNSTTAPKIVEYGEGYNAENVYYYCVDCRTGVVYLSFDGYRRHAMTVMLNRDGSPVTAEQLGIKY